MNRTNENRVDVYQIITDRLIEIMEKGVIPGGSLGTQVEMLQGRLPTTCSLAPPFGQRREIERQVLKR